MKHLKNFTHRLYDLVEYMVGCLLDVRTWMVMRILLIRRVSDVK